MMQKILFFTLFIFFTLTSFAQEADSTEVIRGRVLNAANDLPLEGVNIVNLNDVIGTSTAQEGEFQIKASINDTLFFSYLGSKFVNYVNWILSYLFNALFGLHTKR